MGEPNQPPLLKSHSQVTAKSLLACLLIQTFAPLIGFLLLVLLMWPGGQSYSLLSILLQSIAHLPMIIAAAPEPFVLALLVTLSVACYTRSKQTLYTWNTIIAVLNGLATGFFAVGRSM
jgi:hypothetical protein